MYTYNLHRIVQTLMALSQCKDCVLIIIIIIIILKKYSENVITTKLFINLCGVFFLQIFIELLNKPDVKRLQINN